MTSIRFCTVLFAAAAAAAAVPWACTLAPTSPGAGASGGASEAGDVPFGAGVGASPSVRRPPPARPSPLPPFFDPTLPVAQRVADVVSRLTLEEKVALMQMASPSIPRLGIAPYDWWSEALHGVANTGTATVFPQAIGMAASFDVAMHHDVAQVIGLEGRAKHVQFVSNNDFGRFKGLDFWSPNVNIFRDPRWGRGQETYGEDPYLSGRFAIAFVNGLQGDDPFYFQVVATPKHYAVHSGPESQRHKFNAVITDEDLYTTYLPQFEAAVREGHAYSVMSAYSALDGTPDSGNHRLLTDILRDQWGFNGYVVSDVDSVSDIYLPGSHAFVPTAPQAAALAVKAGNDLNSGTTYGPDRKGDTSNLALAVQRGLITAHEVDIAVGRLMEARIRLGEFDPPGYAKNPYNKITAAMNDLPASDAVAHRMADKSMVLLKNANHTLPLKTNVGAVAVIGPDANALTMQYGNYNGTPSPAHRVSILDGIRSAVGASHVLTMDTTLPVVTDQVALSEPLKADFLFTDVSRSRHGLTIAYAPDYASLDKPTRTAISGTGILPPPQNASDAKTPAARLTGVLVPPTTGDYQLGARARDGFSITIGGKALIDELQGGPLRVAGNAIHLEKDQPYNITIDYAPDGVVGRGGRGGRSSGQLFGASDDAPAMTVDLTVDHSADPLVQLVWTRPTPDGAPADTKGRNLYAEPMDLAKRADAVVLIVGINSNYEGEEPGRRGIGFYGGDRTTIDLPAVQENLIEQVTKAAGDKPVVVVNCSGSAMALNWENDHVPAMLQAWYPGQHGDAVADVLFGKYNPAGRLPVTFYKSTDDLPAFTDYSMANRTYRYFAKPVLFPFGHGLSYSTFEYSALQAPQSIPTGSDMKVSCQVKNTSGIDGEEVVQCYLNREVPPAPAEPRDPATMTDEQATIAATPRKALAGFARVPLKAGERKTVTFTITGQQLSLVDGKDGRREVRPGNVQLQIGGSSAIEAGTLTQAVTIEGQAKVPEYRFVAPEVK